MPQVLILSGTGWVGHQVARILAESKHNVTVTSRGITTRYPVAVGVNTIKMDRNDIDAFEQMIKERKPNIVIDMIPQGSRIEQVINICKSYKVEHYLHCSSTGVYAPLDYVPADEDHPWDRDTGVNFMGKVQVDRAVMNHFKNDGFAATVIRPSYIQGEGLLPLDGLGGRYEQYWQRVGQGQPVAVPNEGMMLLHPVYYQDVANCFLCAIENREASVGQIFNICGDRALPLKHYIDRIIKQWPSSSQIQCVPARDFGCDYVEGFDKGDLGFRFLCEHMCFTNEKAKRLLGWRPQTDLEEGLAKMVEWSKQNIHLDSPL